jgi:hypothetical protein
VGERRRRQEALLTLGQERERGQTFPNFSFFDLRRLNGDFGRILCDSCTNSIEFSLTSNASRGQLENRYVQDCNDTSDDPNPADGNRDVGSLQTSEACRKVAETSESAQRDR